MMEVVWTLGVDLDLQAIYERLDVYRSGTGDRFFEALLETTRQLQLFPQIGPRCASRFYPAGASV
ncbi:hypothetical protein CfE428DRAFT_5657 [Chthoniobacter flavus Ellin428]|uniref:Uncharacterized protein n=1 Tax=Chthoniobacter flavus Ellin428 TaxID=497964 RepID=B4D9R7_9BACT|nr:hypothetical protein CfE428DRAFT_5657 [Chthoniobacter flavus Ellin428]TCO93329.1 hypothetical protein EV701_10431 [Chthoniobacter flavus]